jgi:hypothetical protein
VVVRHLDVVCIAVLETKADPPLLVDADGVLAFAVSAQGVKPIADRDREVIELLRKVNVLQSLHCASDDAGWQTSGLSRDEQVPRVLVSKGLNHTGNA